MTGESERGQDSIDRWLADRHHELRNGLERFLDPAVGLRDAMLHAGHADLLGTLGSTLDTDAGLEAIVTSTTAGGSQPAPPPDPMQRASGPSGNVYEQPLKDLDQTRQRRQLVSPSRQDSLGRGHWPSTSLLGSLDDLSRDRLLRLGAPRQYRTGAVLMREGDSPRFVAVLLDGVVKETALTPSGKEALLTIRVGGDLVGEPEALDDKPRSRSVTTSGVVVGRVISQAEFLGALRDDSHLALMVNRSILARLRASETRRIEFAGYDAPTRVARVVRELAVRYGDRSGDRIMVQWPVTQAELASLAGVAEPTVQKALRSLRASGIVATGYRSMDILDIHALDRIAEQVS